MKRIVVAALLATGAFVAAPSFALTHADMVGQARPTGSAFRTIHVTPKTRAVNVEYRETVNLDINGTVVTWKFDGVDPVVPLTDIVPGAPDILVYIKPGTKFH